MSNANLQVLRPKEVSQMLGIHISSLYRWESEGNFWPKKLQIGAGTVGYLKSDIEAYIRGESQPKTQPEA